MSYTYLRNTAPGRFEQIEFQRDDGSTAMLLMGLRYDLSPTEISRVSPFIVLEFSPLPASAEPAGVYRIPVRGDPDEGQVPVWRETQGAFVPEALAVAAAGASSVPTGIVGGSNLIPNPSFHDGATGYTAGAGTTITPNSIVGVFGADSIFMARSASTGVVAIVSSRVSVAPLVPYSASAWIRLGTLGTSTVRAATITINWYGPADTLISSSAVTASEPINGSWTRLALEGVPSPDTAAKAEVQVSVAGVPTGENHVIDGVQLQVGDVPTNFALDIPASTILGAMLVPGTLTTREISSALVDSIVAAATAAANPIGLWDFPYTLDPRASGVANSAFTANNIY
jgi:hypothetical protein